MGACPCENTRTTLVVLQLRRWIGSGACPASREPCLSGCGTQGRIDTDCHGSQDGKGISGAPRHPDVQLHWHHTPGLYSGRSMLTPYALACNGCIGYVRTLRFRKKVWKLTLPRQSILNLEHLHVPNAKLQRSMLPTILCLCYHHRSLCIRSSGTGLWPGERRCLRSATPR